MTDAAPEVIESINELAEQRFILQLEVASQNQKFKSAQEALQAAHASQLARLQAQIDIVDDKLWQSIESNRGSLIARGKQSFVTMMAKFQFRRSDSKTKVSDTDGVMEVARRLGVVRKIAEPKYVWRLDSKKFLAWLDKHGELRSKFEEFLDESDASESLTMQPNGNYTVHHNSQRISPPSVSIEKS